VQPNDSTIKDFNPVSPDMAVDPFFQLTRLFVYFLQNLYRDAPIGSGLRWSPQEEDTEVIITAEKPKVDALEKIPHITCVLGGSQWGNTSLDQLQGLKYSNGQRTHTDLLSCTMSYHCQAKEGLVARRLAWNCSFYTNVFRRILMKVGGIHHVAPSHSTSPESPPSVYTGPLAETELVSVVVTVPFFWQVQWRITKPAELWRAIRVNMTVNKASPMYSAGRLVPLRPPMIKGKVVKTEPIVTEPPEPAFTQVVLEDAYPKE